MEEVVEQDGGGGGEGGRKGWREGKGSKEGETKEREPNQQCYIRSHKTLLFCEYTKVLAFTDGKNKQEYWEVIDEYMNIHVH